MSERGSFVTQYVYCGKCFKALKKILIQDHKYHSAISLPGWTGLNGGLPIIAGKIGGLYAGEEIHTFEDELVPSLAPKLCHAVRIAVLAEQGEKILTIQPGKKKGPSVTSQAKEKK